MSKPVTFGQAVLIAVFVALVFTAIGGVTAYQVANQASYRRNLAVCDRGNIGRAATRWEVRVLRGDTGERVAYTAWAFPLLNCEESAMSGRTVLIRDPVVEETFIEAVGHQRSVRIRNGSVQHAKGLTP